MQHPPCESCAAKSATPERSITRSPELHIERVLGGDCWPSAQRELRQYAEAADWVAKREREAPAYMACCHANAPESERAARLYREALAGLGNVPEAFESA